MQRRDTVTAWTLVGGGGFVAAFGMLLLRNAGGSSLGALASLLVVAVGAAFALIGCIALGVQLGLEIAEESGPRPGDPS